MTTETKLLLVFRVELNSGQLLWISECAGAGFELFNGKIQLLFLLLLFKPAPTGADYDHPIRGRTLASRYPRILGGFLQSKVLLEAKFRYFCCCNLWDFSAVQHSLALTDALPELYFMALSLCRTSNLGETTQLGRGWEEKHQSQALSSTRSVWARFLLHNFSKTGNEY